VTTKILDVTVGAEKLYHRWHEKLGSDFVGIDSRRGDFSVPKTGNSWAAIRIVIEPTVQADLCFLPFKNEVFSVIIFDPPHLDVSLDSWLGKKWGGWTQHQTIETVRAANKEFQRVLRKDGVLILKVLPREFRLYEALLKGFMFFLPIFTYRTRGSFKQPLPKRGGALWAIARLNN